MSARTRTSLRLKPELKKQYEQLAAADNRNFNQIVELALEIAMPHIKERIDVLKGFRAPVAA